MMAHCDADTKRGETITSDHDYEWIPITDTIPPDPQTVELVQQIRAPFLKGSKFTPHINPISNARLDTPINSVVGMASKNIYRGNFSDHPTLPGVTEGTSHNFLTDAFRAQGKTDIGTIRGFRYGTYVRRGPITLADLFTYLNAGAQVASGTVPGSQIKQVLEKTIDGALNADPFQWGGGWLFGFSGLRYNLDLSLPKGSRALDLMVLRQSTDLWEPLDAQKRYSVTGYWFDRVPNRVGVFTNAADVRVMTHPDGSSRDATEVVVDYLKNHDADPDTGRARLLQPLPPQLFGNPEIQPLRGAAIQ